jgi:Ca2+/Na+ antiporter
MSYKIPIAFMISALGIGIVFLVIQKKMELYKTYPRMSALVALITGTLVLLVINTIVSNLLGVFMIATISWAVYCLEYMAKENIISEENGKKTESDLLGSLRKALDK